jgi:hypothetical protein
MIGSSALGADMHDAGGGGGHSFDHSAGHSSMPADHHHSGHGTQQQADVPYYAPRGQRHGSSGRATRILFLLIFAAALVAAVMAALNLHF